MTRRPRSPSDIRILRFRCIMGDWTYQVVYSRFCVIGYFKSRKAARAFAADYLQRLRAKRLATTPDD